MVTGRSAQRLEESKCHSCVQEEQEEGLGELQVGQPHFDPEEGNGAANSGSHFQANEGEESHLE